MNAWLPPGSGAGRPGSVLSGGCLYTIFAPYYYEAMKKPMAWALALFLSSVLPGELQSSTILKLTFQQLVHGSDAVIIGKVVSKESDASGPVTLTRNVVDVEACLLGVEKLEDPVIEIFTLGGSKGGGVAVHVFGEARFGVGERFLAFLELRGGRWRVRGMAQGKMTVKNDPSTGTDMVLPPDKINVVTPKDGKLVKGKPFLTEPVTLDGMVDDILREKENHVP